MIWIEIGDRVGGDPVGEPRRVDRSPVVLADQLHEVAEPHGGRCREGIAVEVVVADAIEYLTGNLARSGRACHAERGCQLWFEHRRLTVTRPG